MDYGNDINCYYLLFNDGIIMSDLRIKPNIENRDLPKDFDGHSVEKLHKVIDRKIKILEDSNKLQEYCKQFHGRENK